MHAITLHVVLRAVFGLEEGARLDRLASSLRRLMTWTTDPRRGLVFGLLGPDRLMGLAGFRRQLAEVDGQLLAEIARRREAADLGDRADILSLLLRARDEDGEALSDRELRDELMTLLVAGYETTAAALSWALTEVARDPQAQARLADGEPGLAEAAITETLRLHPPVPLGSLRRLRDPMTIAGWQLPAGATVASCSLLVHRRPEVYAHPTEWQVDRFLRTRPPAGAWLPFGGGVRRCVGAAFAQFEARTVLDELIARARTAPRGHIGPPDRTPRHRDRPPARRPRRRRAPPRDDAARGAAFRRALSIELVDAQRSPPALPLLVLGGREKRRVVRSCNRIAGGARLCTRRAIPADGRSARRDGDWGTVAGCQAMYRRTGLRSVPRR